VITTGLRCPVARVLYAGLIAVNLAFGTLRVIPFSILGHD
jgi:hypothetical protein